MITVRIARPRVTAGYRGAQLRASDIWPTDTLVQAEGLVHGRWPGGQQRGPGSPRRGQPGSGPGVVQQPGHRRGQRRRVARRHEHGAAAGELLDSADPVATAAPPRAVPPARPAAGLPSCSARPPRRRRRAARAHRGGRRGTAPRCRPGLAAEVRVQRPFSRDQQQRDHRPPLPPRSGRDERAETLLGGEAAHGGHDHPAAEFLAQGRYLGG